MANKSLELRAQGSLGKEQNTDHWCSGLTCFPVTEEITGSNPVWSAIIKNSRCMPVYIDGIKNKPLRGDARNIETGRDKLSATLG